MDGALNDSTATITEAHIDEETGKLILYLSNGVICAVPPICIPALTTLEPSDRVGMVISDGGEALRWPNRGLELSLTEILSAAIGG